MCLPTVKDLRTDLVNNSPMLPAYSQQLKALSGGMNGVLAESLHVYPGVCLLVYCKWVHSLWISEHIVELFIVELD